MTADDTNNEHKEEEKEDMNLAGIQFANFAASHKFKFAVAALFRDTYKNMRPKHFENLKKLFTELDTDGNGKISYSEFEEGMLRCNDLNLDSNEIKKMFRELDVNNLGEIEFENLLTAAIHDYLIANDVRLYKAFRDLDKNDSGKIETSVLKQKIRELNPYGDVNMILKIIDQVDLDQDGAIDYTEFLRALHPNFNKPPKWFPGTKKVGASDEESSESDAAADDNKNNDNENDQKTNRYRPHSASKPVMMINTKKNNQIKKPRAASTTKAMVNDHKKIRNKIERIPPKSLDMNGVLKAGYMKKQGGRIRTWHKRWFVLQNNGVLSYYEDENDDEPIKGFNIKNHTKIANKTYKNKYGIKIYTEHRDWKFLLENGIERRLWIAAFNQACKQ
eukprot:471541_1